MSNTKHTPTPWERCDAFGASAMGLNVKATGDDKMICSTTGYYGRDGAAANAAFIARACNSHEQLVAALEAARMVIETSDDQEPQMIAALSQIEAALAAAEA